jgi:hypothetical protein
MPESKVRKLLVDDSFKACVESWFKLQQNAYQEFNVKK